LLPSLYCTRSTFRKDSLMRRTLIATAVAAAVFMPLATQAKPLHWASQGDILTLDPHAQNEGLTIAGSSYVYEPLVQYNETFELSPALATAWEQASPTVWRFTLRENVKFHDGTPFEADDVVFSIKRAMAPTSHFKAYVNGIKDGLRVDGKTVEIETAGPNPVLLRQLTNVFIMNRDWAEKNNATEPQDFSKKEETFSARNTNGTGPYRLVSREVDVRTVYEENPDWWGKPNKKGNVTKITYTPIKQSATRTAALLSGE